MISRWGLRHLWSGRRSGQSAQLFYYFRMFENRGRRTDDTKLRLALRCSASGRLSCNNHSSDIMSIFVLKWCACGWLLLHYLRRSSNMRIGCGRPLDTAGSIMARFIAFTAGVTTDRFDAFFLVFVRWLVFVCRACWSVFLTGGCGCKHRCDVRFHFCEIVDHTVATSVVRCVWCMNLWMQRAVCVPLSASAGLRSVIAKACGWTSC